MTSSNGFQQVVKADKVATESVKPTQSLNLAQSQAVQCLVGPLLVLAGAGTGKTRVLTHRLAELIKQGKAKPWQVMAVTFTNKAAREMQARTAKIIGTDLVKDVWLGTFHSLGARMLRKYAQHFGLTSGFTIINQDDQHRLLKRLMQQIGLDEEIYDHKYVANILNRYKDECLDPRAEAQEDLQELFHDYQRSLLGMNAVDFADLIYLNIKLWHSFPEVLKFWQDKFHYILVEEYQDTNQAQYQLLKLLAGKFQNIACVGDDDQSIYSWRGADINNILRFQNDYPNAKIIRLEENYRSTEPILACANHLIRHNQGRWGKELFVQPAMVGLTGANKVRVTEYHDSEAEADAILEKMLELVNEESANYQDIAVLVRTSAQTQALETRLSSNRVPYRVVGGAKFYDREEIRDALAYLRLLQGDSDDLAFRRVVNKPKRGMGDKSLEKLQQHADNLKQELGREVGLFETLIRRVKMGEEKSLALKELVRIITDLRKKIFPNSGMADDAMLETAVVQPAAGLFSDSEGWPPPEPIESPEPNAPEITIDDELGRGGLAHLTKELLELVGYLAMWRQYKEKEIGQEKLNNLEELYLAMEPYPNLTKFLEEVALATDGDDKDDGNKVSLMTMHAAKGLEFPIVFLSGWEEGLFPSMRSLEAIGQKALEEERRLAYVAITRAMRQLYISHANRRRLYGNNWQTRLPSRFIKELDKNFIIQEKSQTEWLLGDGPMGGVDDEIILHRQSKGGMAAPEMRPTKYYEEISPQGGNLGKTLDEKLAKNNQLGTARKFPQPLNGAPAASVMLNQGQNNQAKIMTPANHWRSLQQMGAVAVIGRIARHPRFGRGKIQKLEGAVCVIELETGKLIVVLAEFVDILVD